MSATHTNSSLTCSTQLATAIKLLFWQHSRKIRPRCNYKMAAENNFTPLLRAACSGRTAMVNHLIVCGADVHATDSQEGWTPLHHALYQGYSDIAEALIWNDARLLQAAANDGRTPLFLAAGAGHLESLERILTVLETDGFVPRDSDFILQTINHTTNGANMLHYAAARGREECVSLLVERFPHLLRMKDKLYGHTPFLNAICSDSVGIVRSLLESHPEVALDCSRIGWTPLHLALDRNSWDCAAYLIQATPECVLGKDYDEDTPLHVATHQGQMRGIELLLAVADADIKRKLIKSRASDGNTALHVAVLKANTTCVTLLLDCISSELLSHLLFVKNNELKTPLDIALEKVPPDPAIVMAIQQAGNVVALPLHPAPPYMNAPAGHDAAQNDIPPDLGDAADADAADAGDAAGLQAPEDEHVPAVMLEPAVHPLEAAASAQATPELRALIADLNMGPEHADLLVQLGMRGISDLRVYLFEEDLTWMNPRTAREFLARVREEAGENDVAEAARPAAPVTTRQMAAALEEGDEQESFNPANLAGRPMTAGALALLMNGGRRRLGIVSAHATECKERAFGLVPAPSRFGVRPGANGLGEDAFFINADACAAGVADGVGSCWPSFGMDAGEAARFMMSRTHEKLNGPTPLNLCQALRESHAEMMHRPNVGATTLAAYQLRGDQLKMFVAGDSCIMVIRPGTAKQFANGILDPGNGYNAAYVRRTTLSHLRQNGQNVPTQLGFQYGPGAPQSTPHTPITLWGADGNLNINETVLVQPGDIIVASTDGILDCLATDCEVPSYEESNATWSSVANTVLWACHTAERAKLNDEDRAQLIATHLLAIAKQRTFTEPEAGIGIRTIHDAHGHIVRRHPYCTLHPASNGNASWTLWDTKKKACEICRRLHVRSGSCKPDDLTVVVSVVQRPQRADGAGPAGV